MQEPWGDTCLDLSQEASDNPALGKCRQQQGTQEGGIFPLAVTLVLVVLLVSGLFGWFLHYIQNRLVFHLLVPP